MLDDLDRLGPELTLMSAAGLVILWDLVLKESLPLAKRGSLLASGALAGIAGSIIWTVTLILRDREGAAFENSLVVDNFSLFFKFLFLGVAILVILASVDYAPRFGRRQGEYFA